jgi:hypothetical protein
MNLEMILAVSEVIGAVAIIASLIYVAAQIRQSTTIARATIIHATNSDAMRFQELIAQNAELAAIYEKGTTGISLAGTELVRFLALVDMSLLWLEDIDSQHKEGLYFQDESLEDVVDKLAVEVLPFFSTPEVREWWRTTQSQTYFPDFAERIDRHLSEHKI